MVSANQRADDHIEGFIRKVNFILLEKLDSLIAFKHITKNGLGEEEKPMIPCLEEKIESIIKIYHLDVDETECRTSSDEC